MIEQELTPSLVVHNLKEGEEHFNNKNFSEALCCIDQCLLYEVDSSLLAHIYYKLALCFKGLKNYGLAIDYFKKSSVLVPNFEENYRMLGDIYSFDLPEKDYINAIFYYEKYADLKKDNQNLYRHLALINSESGYPEKSMRYSWEALRVDPGLSDTVENLFFYLPRVPGYSQEKMYQLGQKALETYTNAHKIQLPKSFHHTNQADPHKKINLAYISADFYQLHPVMYFMEEVLAHHDHENFNVTLYSNVEHTDATTERIEKYADYFHSVRKLSNTELEELIKKDEIDVLVDLSGYTAGNRLLALANKPAPVQVTYVGYPNTTGLNAFDYFMTTKYLSRPGEEEFFSEKFYYLDCPYRCYKTLDTSIPEINSAPVLENGYITFSSFNNISKCNEELIAIWARILHAIPNSKFYICRYLVPVEDIKRRFAVYGISMDRIIVDKIYTLSKYHNVDILLDTFPYSGCTTTFNAISMGIPVVTLYGETFAGRESANVNYHLDLKDLIAKDHEEYIEIAVKLAKDQDRISQYRKILRDKLQSSVFCDYAKFTRSFERAYRDMWKAWCKMQTASQVR